MKKRILALMLASVMVVNTPMAVCAEEIIDVSEQSVEAEAYSEEADESALLQEDVAGTNQTLEVVTFLEGQDIFSKYKVDFALSSTMKAQKAELYSVLNDLDYVVSGRDYIDGQLVAIVDDKEMAEDVAEGFEGKLLDYREGVATIETDLSTKDAVTLAANPKTNLPAVYPNYIYSIDDTKKQQMTEVERTRTIPEELNVEQFRLEAEKNAGKQMEEDITAVKEHYLEAAGAEQEVVEAAIDTTSEWNTGAAYPYNDPDISKQWHHKMMDTFGAWTSGTKKGKGVTVAVIDTGIDKTHPEFAGRVSAVSMYEDNDGSDDNGHGTHVAGIIAAAADNGIGGCGVAPEANILAVKVLDSDGSGSTAKIIAGIEYVVDKSDARVINMSLGGPSGVSDIPYEAAVKRAVQKGKVVIVAAGNDTSDISKAEFKASPACFKDAVTVASLDVNGTLSNFSNYGKIDISAPGGTGAKFAEQDIYSTYPVGLDGSDGFTFMPGTSMASPAVAGVAALMVATGEYGSNADGVKALVKKLRGTAVKLGNAKQYGAGRVNAAFAVDGMSIYSKGDNFNVVAGKKLALKALKSGKEKVEWKVSDEKVCTISNSGALKANKEVQNKTVVTVTATCGSKIATVDVTVWPDNKATVTGDQKSVEIEYGKTVTYQATTSDGSPVVYKSSNNKVAVVSSTGVVRALGNGTATITATAVNGKKASLKVKVTGTPYIFERIVPVSAKDRKGIDMFANSELWLDCAMINLDSILNTTPVSEGKTVKYKAIAIWPYNTSSDKTIQWDCTAKDAYNGSNQSGKASIHNGVLKVGKNLTHPTLVEVTATTPYMKILREGKIVQVYYSTFALACKPMISFNFNVTSGDTILTSKIQTSTSKQIRVGETKTVDFDLIVPDRSSNAYNPYPYVESSNEEIAEATWGIYKGSGWPCVIIKGKKAGKCKVTLISMDGAYKKSTISVTVK